MWKNQYLKLLFSRRLRPKFPADTARCHHTNAGLKFVLVEQINNTRLREYRKTDEHALHIDAKMACSLSVLQKLDLTQIKFPTCYKLLR